MSNKKGGGGNKQKKDRMLRQMGAKTKAKQITSAVKEAQKSVTRGEMRGTHNTMNLRIDAGLMGVAAVAEILVKNKLCSYEDIRTGEKGMLEVMYLIRTSMDEALKVLGKKAKPEDIGAYVYDKAIEAKVDKALLENIFGIKPSKSRIIKPHQVKTIITP